MDAPVSAGVLFNGSRRMLETRKADRKKGQIKIKQSGKDSFSIGKETVDLKYVEQLIDYEQVTTLSYCLKALIEQMETRKTDAVSTVDRLWAQIQAKGLKSLCPGSYCLFQWHRCAGRIYLRALTDTGELNRRKRAHY